MALISADYFRKYSRDDGRSYDESWRDYSRIDSAIRLAKVRRLKSTLVLGAATGGVLRDLHKSLGVMPRGCEVSRWAHARIPARYRAQVVCADMRNWVPKLVREGATFDLVFTNSLIYLPSVEILPLLRQIARLGRFVHFESSFSESHCEDPFRITLKPAIWWARRFREAGFEGTRSRYLWRSTCFDS